jgi:ketosteroid isomerase-like protein
MADLAATIETMEHRWMRAWVRGDLKVLKAITARDFIFLAASSPPAILDRPSWLDAAKDRYVCSSYSFGGLYVRGWASVALFSATLDLKATIDGRDWSGKLWVTDVWRKGRVRRGWKLAQRIVSRPDEDPQLRTAIKALQLWK